MSTHSVCEPVRLSVSLVGLLGAPRRPGPEEQALGRGARQRVASPPRKRDTQRGHAGEANAHTAHKKQARKGSAQDPPKKTNRQRTGRPRTPSGPQHAMPNPHHARSRSVGLIHAETQLPADSTQGVGGRPNSHRRPTETRVWIWTPSAAAARTCCWPRAGLRGPWV